MVLLHPRSTLFPYTTLFRSGEQEGGWDELPDRHHPAQLPNHERLGVAVLVVHPRQLPHGLAGIVLRHDVGRSEEHTSELQSHSDLVCRLLFEKKNLENPLT